MTATHRRLALLLGVAALIKAVYLLEYLSLPFYESPLFDSLVYLRQAQAVRAGDLGHPTLLAFSPLYGYFLAAFEPYAVPLQQLMGLGAIALVYRVARTLTVDDTKAFVAAALYLGYGVTSFYETKIGSEPLGMLLLLGAYAIYVERGFAKGRAAPAIACGIVLGLAVLARASLLLSAPFFVVCAALPWKTSQPLPERALRASWLTIGLCCVLGANGALTWSYTGRFVPVIMSNPTAAAAASRQGGWEGSFAVFSTSGGNVSPWDHVRQTERRLRGEAVDAPSFDVAGYLVGAGPKALLTLRDEETTFEYGYYGERNEALALRLLTLSFGGLLLCAVIGAAMRVDRDGARTIVRYLPLVLGTLALSTLFHPSTRYRLPIVVPLVLLGGDALVELFRREAGRARTIALSITIVVVGGLAVRSFFRPLASPGMWHLRVAESEARRGDLDAARERIERARLEQPGDPQVQNRIEYVERLMRPR